MFNSRFWKNFDWPMFGVMILLVAMGLLVIWSTTFKATRLDATSDVWQQGLFAGIGLVVFFLMARVDYHAWARLTGWLYGLMVAMLIWVALFSSSVLGAQRWINFGFFQFQPAEFAKLVLILVLAKFFAQYYDQLHKVKYLAMSLLILAVPMALVMRQPDLGTALVLGAIWISMALVSRISKVQLGILAVAGLASLPFIISTLKPFQRARIEAFINPAGDPLHTGYNAVQSTITVGSGQVFGRGLAAGSQSQLNFLPSLAQHTDFIFAVLSEKMGFVGGTLLILLFAVLLYRGVKISYQAQDRFGMFIAVGITAMILFHVFINAGMNMGIAPVTGIPLPFVSYGGTAMIILMAMMGLLMSVAIRRKKLQFGS